MFHDAVPFQRPDLTPGFRRTDFDDYLRCLARFPLIVTCSNESRDALLACWRDLGCAPARIIVELWPADFGPRGQADPSRFEKSRVLYVSTLDPRKNHLTLFAACERLWNEGIHFELELIGRQLADARASKPVIDGIHRLKEEGRDVLVGIAETPCQRCCRRMVCT